MSQTANNPLRFFCTMRFGQKLHSAFPLSAVDVPALFDPDQCDTLTQRCANSYFVHLFNETWRRAGIPRYLGPPEGSFMEHLLLSHGINVPMPRMEFGDVKRWTAYLTLHEEFQAGLSAYRLANDALRSKVDSLEQKKRIGTMSNTPSPAKNIEDEVRELKNRIVELEARTRVHRSRIFAVATPRTPSLATAALMDVRTIQPQKTRHWASLSE